jgi:asparagine synthase (glutamine-hydrolysing)
MCGIVGEIVLGGKTPDSKALTRMMRAVAPRGPDGSGVFCTRRVGLGHRRLAVIDLSVRGHQPMVDSQLGLAIVFNGCIYNYRALRAELCRHGYRFSSESDTEVVLKGFHHWGDNVTAHLNGIFAFAIADLVTGDVVLARDRLGIKPLYTALVAEGLRFASTLQSLLAGGGIDTAVDPYALHHYLSFHSVVPGPRTILASVRRVMPATLVRIDGTSGRMHETRYWKASFTRLPERAQMRLEEWADVVLDGLRRAVRLQLEADVPVGVLLSGGLDSSLLVALIAQADGSLPTYTIGFDSAHGISGDEFAYSDLVAAMFGTEHHRFHASDAEILSALPGTLAAMSEPMASRDAVAFYLLAEQVRKELKVVQSGQGADELFGGYERYQAFAHEPRPAFKEYVTLLDRSHREISGAVKEDYRLKRDVTSEFLFDHIGGIGADTEVDRALRFDSEVRLVDDPLKRVDNMAMAWGVESRVPYLDHELVELAAACPPEFKLGHGGKGVLKAVARRVLPGTVIDRDKGSFPVPAMTRLEGGIFELARDALLSERARARGIFRQGYITEVINRQPLTPSGDSQLWQLAVLELWLTTHGL